MGVILSGQPLLYRIRVGEVEVVPLPVMVSEPVEPVERFLSVYEPDVSTALASLALPKTPTSSPPTDLRSVKVAPFGCIPNASVLRTSASGSYSSGLHTIAAIAKQQ